MGAHHPGGDMCLLAFRPHLCQSKVGQFRIKILIIIIIIIIKWRKIMIRGWLKRYMVEEDVWGLEIAVNDGLVGAVEEGQALRRSDRDL